MYSNTSRRRIHSSNSRLPYTPTCAAKRNGSALVGSPALDFACWVSADKAEFCTGASGDGLVIAEQRQERACAKKQGYDHQRVFNRFNMS